MHYTSVAIIMKVIEPLFLNDLKQQLDNASGNEKKLTKLLERILMWLHYLGHKTKV